MGTRLPQHTKGAINRHKNLNRKRKISNPTKIEWMMYHKLKAWGIKFQGPGKLVYSCNDRLAKHQYIVDFYLSNPNYVWLEIDGGYHFYDCKENKYDKDRQIKYDRQKDWYYTTQRNGRVIRISNTEVPNLRKDTFLKMISDIKRGEIRCIGKEYKEIIEESDKWGMKYVIN